VLSWSCRRFRSRFTPGAPHPHRRACEECDAYAAALEQAAGLRLPLPAALHSRLRSIAAPPSGTVLPFPVPRRPLPAATAERLRDLGPARSQRPAPPEWIRSPRYALAASAIFALLLGPYLIPAADRGLRTLGTVREELSPLAQHTLENFQQAALSAEASARRTVTESVHGLSLRLSTFVHELSRGDF
jgi:hypothetical protein